MKKITLMLLTSILVLVMSIVVFADNIVDTNTSNADSITSGDEKETEKEEESNKIIGMEDMIGEKVEQEQIDDYVDTKGTNVVNVIRKGALYVDMVFFVISLIVLISGAVAKNSNLGKGIIGVLITLIVFVGIYYAPQILFAFKNYMKP